MSNEFRSSKKSKTYAGEKKKKLSLYPLNLEDAIRAVVATGPIAPQDRKPKPKKKAR
jgi:hypothetical protein